MSYRLKDQLEVLVISHKYPPSIGGMQKHCYELVKGLSKTVKIHSLIQTEGVSKLWFFFTVVNRALKILKNNSKIDLIYVNDGLMAFVLTRLINRTKVPMVATIHGLDVVFPMKFYQNWVKKKLAKYAAIIAVSQATADECISRGVDPKSVFMVANGFEPEAQKIKDTKKIVVKLRDEHRFDIEGKRIIVSVGRGVSRKGFSWFSRNIIPDLPQDVCYLIIGPGANTKQIQILRKLLPKSIFRQMVLFAGLAIDELEIEQTIDELGLQNRVKRISNLSYQELNALVQLADISVMPNIKFEGDFEGFGLVALEAASNGTVCVAAGIEGIKTAIEDGKNGILLESGNKEIWVDKINALLSDPDELKRLSLKYQKHTLEHSFSWDQMTNEYLRVFEKVVNRKID